MKHKILIAAAFLSFSACMKIKKKGDENKVEPSPVELTERVDENKEVLGPSYEVNELEYDYQVGEGSVKQIRFKVPSDWPKTVLVKKTDADKVFEMPIHLNPNGEWYDLLMSENKIGYQFFSAFGKQLVLLDEVEVLPMLSLTVDEDLNLNKKFNLNAKTKLIYFENLTIGLQKHIYLDDYSGKIIIKNLDSKAGFIQSYAANARAKNDTDGKDGGILDIEIFSGQGSLTVFMKGENGGHGSIAKAPDSLIKGAAGYRGTASKFNTKSEGPYLIPSYYCISAPGDGSEGSKGLTGYPGNSGNSGGHSGMANIINYSDNLEIALTSQEGAFGIGSPGGVGGEGGDGGKGGDGGEEDLQILVQSQGCRVDSSTGKCFLIGSLEQKCTPGANGEKGGIGDPGLSGGNGVSGTKQKSCLRAADQKLKCINE